MGSALDQTAVNNDQVDALLRRALLRLEEGDSDGVREQMTREKVPKLTLAAVRASTRYLTLFTLECLERSVLEAEIDAQVKCSLQGSRLDQVDLTTGDEDGTVRDPLARTLPAAAIRVQPEHVLRIMPQLLLDF
ncbi:hypothetical protein F1559_002367 [Cyanidiococcus yangmingshanensis]|uniref:Uncharacterized protein n=1 Tax=Cyanidiococcus yangmingshanensis TaxID=2690220 RepID=A0A7J7IFT7_9RHOD|nr:hypothetical protein F1559_002367 [Cyanidiococcus yangmingshanensis]